MGQESSDQAGSADRVIEMQFNYLIYQNPDGLVRQELVSAPLADSVGIGRDVALYDFPKGFVVAFDKARPLAVRYQLDDIDKNPFLPQATDLGWRDTLGYRCRGAENREHFPRTTLIAIRQTWVAVEIGFKKPLLDTRKYVKPDGEETYTATRVISNVKRVRWLSPSLFSVPHNYKITAVKPEAAG
jgi:hypothetical protein